MACFDTSFLIDLHGRRRAEDQHRAEVYFRESVARGEILVTTRFSVAELYVGLHRSTNPERERRLIESVLERLEVLEFTTEAAEAFGRVQSHRLRIGRPVAEMDILIAVTAAVHGHAVVTRNTRHFIDMPGIEVVDY